MLSGPPRETRYIVPTARYFLCTVLYITVNYALGVCAIDMEGSGRFSTVSLIIINQIEHIL